ncbi:MAG: HDIG domain-containing protein [Dehalococcoidia bacterium]
MLRRRPHRVVTGNRAAAFGVLLAASVAILLSPILPARQEVREGDLAPRTYPAARDAQYPSEALTAAARDEAERQVEPVLLPPSAAVGARQADALAVFLAQVRDIRARPVAAQQQLAELNALPAAARVTSNARSYLILLERAAFDAFTERARKALAEVMAGPIGKDEVAAKLNEYLARQGNNPGTEVEQTLLRDTLRAFVEANVEVDQPATDAKRDAARANVSPVIVTFTRGQVIATEGQLLDAGTIEALRETGTIEDGFDYYRIGGAGLFAAGMGVLLGLFAFQLQPFSAAPGRRLFATAALVVAAVAAARLLLPVVTPDTDQRSLGYALPVAAAAMVVASYSELSFALAVAAVTGFAAAFAGAVAPDLAGSGFISSLEALEFAMVYATAGFVGAAAVHRAERLGRYIWAALAVAAAGAGAVAVFWLVSEPHETMPLGWALGTAATGGVASALIALGCFVGLPGLFGVTTRLQLMELTHPGHPLLRRLQDEAPGTYHHSMMVGALAERAADGIGADSLLARVGAYFHDIGKLERPVYYIENQLEGAASPHDALTPTESATFIRDHVVNGLELARRYRLPRPVRDFIPEHHGTRLVTYFYRRAMQADASQEPGPFRYSGPRPQSRETAIVMLADSCEAIVRANQERTRPAMEDLIDGILAERLAEGQLDECDLTMRELQEVAASFKATLRAVYHPRIAYPSPAPEEIARIAQRTN